MSIAQVPTTQAVEFAVLPRYKVGKSSSKVWALLIHRLGTLKVLLGHWHLVDTGGIDDVSLVSCNRKHLMSDFGFSKRNKKI